MINKKEALKRKQFHLRKQQVDRQTLASDQRIAYQNLYGTGVDGSPVVDPPPSFSPPTLLKDSAPHQRPCFGKVNLSVAQAFASTLGTSWGFMSAKAQAFSFRHRRFRYLSRHDRFYFTCATAEWQDDYIWTAKQDLAVSMALSDHQPVMLLPRLKHPGARTQQERLPKWTKRNPHGR